MLSLMGLTKEYSLGKTVVHTLQGIDLAITAGDFVAISGPSGSGKSTLLNLMGCLDIPTDGTIRIMGEDVSRLHDSELSRLRNRHIGFIFQTFNLISVLTAYENVEYPLWIQNIRSQERRGRALKMLDEVGLSHLIKHRPDELSGGQ